MSKATSTTSTPKYRRILLKLSGEALRTPGSHDTISPEIVHRVAEDIQKVHALGVDHRVAQDKLFVRIGQWAQAHTADSDPLRHA